MQIIFHLILISILMFSGAAYADGEAAAMARAHADDVPVATPVASTEPVLPVESREIEYGQQGGEALTGFLAMPAGGADDLPAVIVIHEWWGLNDNIRRVTERLAGEGYRALAVDLYRGEVAPDPKTAMRLSSGLRKQGEQTDDNLLQAYAFLNDGGAPRVGVIGWCLGGRWSLRTALLLPDQVDATVIYYGSLVTDPEQLKTLQMPVLGNFGGADPIIPQKDIQAFEGALRDLGKQVDVKVYPGAKHAFSNPSGTAYDAPAAEDAWARSRAFLAANLKQP
ncbi:MAG: dienelactone hydrolase family protein [Gammaproteobacteria bacterium]